MIDTAIKGEKSISFDVISLEFAILFFILTLLNTILVDIIPGAIFIILALLYIPHVKNYLLKILHFNITPFVQVIVGIVIFWETLAAGDLMEIFEAWLQRG